MLLEVCKREWRPAFELSSPGSEAVAGHYNDLLDGRTHPGKTRERTIDSRLVLLKLCIGKECFFVTARKFLGGYPDSIRFGSHLSSLAAKAAPGKVVTKEENMIPMLSNERSGDPFHLHDTVLHNNSKAKQLPPEESAFSSNGSSI
jgi:hypothetical protein